MTTPCDRLKTLLATTPEVADALPTLEAGLATHAASCPTCERELERARALVRSLKGLHADFAPRADVVARALSKTAEAPRRSKGALLGAGLVGAGLAAGLVLMLQPSAPGPGASGGVVVAGTPGDAGAASVQDVVNSANAVNAANGHTDVAAVNAEPGLVVKACLGEGESSCTVGPVITTAIGETKSFRLSDGTTMHLDQDSEVALSGEARAIVVRRGDAWFDVVKHPELQPLAVTLPTGEVSVLGTELIVRAGETMSFVEVRRGLVSVAGAGGSEKVGAGQAAYLRAGRKPIVRVATGGWSSGDEQAAPGYENLGFGSLRARRPGAKADTDRPLRLTDHLVDVRVQGGYAKTTIEEGFASDEAHELEGVYRFTLPPGAQVAELSLLVDGRWEEGAFVERERAEKIWAGVIRNATPVIKRREVIEYIWVPGPWRDPALLSWKQGNTFELRIFPIPARGERRVRIAYTESLPLVTGGRRYVLPLPAEGSAVRAERFSFQARVGTTLTAKDLRVRNYAVERGEGEGAVTLSKEARGFRPTGDLVVDIPDLAATDELTALGWGRTSDGATDGYMALTLRPDLAHGAAETVPLDVVAIVDTSYGIQATRLGRAAELVERIVAGLREGDRVEVLACATTCRTLGGLGGASEARGRELRERVARIEPLGATDLVGAFATARKAFEAAGTPSARRRIVYIGDGIQTVGELDGPRVLEALRAESGETRVSAVALGGETDPVVLTGLAREHAGSFLDAAALGSLAQTGEAVVARLRLEPLREVELVLPDGVELVAPANFGELWPGEERVVTARVRKPELAGDVILRGRMGDEQVERRWSFEVNVAETAGHAFVPRLWAERRIADLSLREDSAAREEIVALSQSHHLMSRHTSLLVLESPAMARAFGVETTRPVASWDGEAPIEAQAGELRDAVGAKDALGAGIFGGEDAGGGGFAITESELDANDYKTLAKGDADAPSAGRGKGTVTATPTVPRQEPERLRDPMPDRRGGEWVAMRKVWYKEATIDRHGGHDTWAERQLAQREDHLDAAPDSRERTMAVVRMSLRLGALDRARTLTSRWLERDRMDPEALIAMADVAALEGDLAKARLWVASAVEADPRQPAAHGRLARLYDAMGEVELACAHRLSRALVARGDVQAQVEAARCGQRERVLAGLEDGVRRRVERALEADPRDLSVSGPFQLEATWEGAVDLDLVVVDPDGRVVSWLGGAELSARDVTSLERERLAFKGQRAGRWQVFAVRSRDAESAPERVSGTLRITAHGATRRLGFELESEQAVAAIADIDVRSLFRMEPVR